MTSPNLFFDGRSRSPDQSQHGQIRSISSTPSSSIVCLAFCFTSLRIKSPPSVGRLRTPLQRSRYLTHLFFLSIRDRRSTALGAGPFCALGFSGGQDEGLPASPPRGRAPGRQCGGDSKFNFNMALVRALVTGSRTRQAMAQQLQLPNKSRSPNRSPRRSQSTSQSQRW